MFVFCLFTCLYFAYLHLYFARLHRCIFVLPVAQLLASDPRMSMLTQDNYQEKLSILDEAKGLSLSQWKAGHVLAWLEIDMNMAMYGKTCLENIKSGKVLD